MNIPIISTSVVTVSEETFWRFRIDPDDAISIENNPIGLRFTTAIGDAYLNTEVYAGSPVNPYGDKWSIFSSGGNKYVSVLYQAGNPYFGTGVISEFSAIDLDETGGAAYLSIDVQPAEGSLNVAYRPIVVMVGAYTMAGYGAGELPPVVYCDIYVNDVYYKTLSKTVPNSAMSNTFLFDIQDALQELLTYSLPTIDGGEVEAPTQSFRRVFVKIRNAAFNSDGFLVQQQTPPIQATAIEPAVSGLGKPSNEFYVFNATIQHEEKMDFAELMNSYKTGTWDAQSFPLTRRPKVFKLCKNDSSFFPIISDQVPSKLCLTYKTIDGDTITNCLSIGEVPVCPYVDYPGTFVVYNGDGTQTISLSWAGPPAPDYTANVVIKYYPVGTDPEVDGYTGEITAPVTGASGPQVTLPVGLYNFVLEIVGECTPAPNPSTIFNAGFDPDEIVVSIAALIEGGNCKVGFTIDQFVDYKYIVVEESSIVVGGVTYPMNVSVLIDDSIHTSSNTVPSTFPLTVTAATLKLRNAISSSFITLSLAAPEEFSFDQATAGESRITNVNLL